MPKEIKDLKEFMNLFKNQQASEKPKKASNEEEKKHPRNQFKKKLLQKKKGNVTKFKLRTSRYLYTFKTNKTEVIKKILKTLPSEIEKVDLDKTKKK